MLGGSYVSGSSVGAAEVVEVVEVIAGAAEAVVVLVVVVVVLAEVDVGAAVGVGPDASSTEPGAGGKLCSSAAASAAAVEVSGCVTVASAAPAAGVAAELLVSLLSVEQAVASRAADTAVASRNFVVFICLDERPGTQQY